MKHFMDCGNQLLPHPINWKCLQMVSMLPFLSTKPHEHGQMFLESKFRHGQLPLAWCSLWGSVV